MGYYTNGEKDFFLRTFKIIEQYNKKEVGEEEKYEVTLLINCLFGILILINNEWVETLKDIKLDEIEKIVKIKYYKLSKDILKYERKKEENIVRNVADLIKSMRNGICHWKEGEIDQKEGQEKLKGIIFSEQNNKIKKITIQGTLYYEHAIDITFNGGKNLYEFLVLLKKNIGI